MAGSDICHFVSMVTNPALVNMFCPEPFPEVEACRVEGRGSQTIVSDLDGTLLRSRSAFPYFMLVAFEAGSALRSILLLLLSPLIWILYNFFSETAGIKMLIFLSCAGLEASVIESVARGVLPKFYLEDMHSVSYRVFLSCGKRYVVTANPRIMVEHFLKEHLDVEAVMGTELQISQSGYATGFVTGLGVLVGANKERAVKKYFSDDLPDVALGDSVSDYPFMALCKVNGHNTSCFPLHICFSVLLIRLVPKANSQTKIIESTYSTGLSAAQLRKMCNSENMPNAAPVWDYDFVEC